MIFRLAQKKDAWQIADIHKQEIKRGFLSVFSNNFLAEIYSAIVDSKYSFCIVAEENNEVKGFIAGVADLNKFYFSFLKRYFFSAVFFVFPHIFSFTKIKKIIGVLFYPVKEKKLSKEEILSMAVRSQFQGQGIAGQMLEKFIFEMKNKGVGDFKVVVGESLAPAIKFYEKSGFKFIKNINIHENHISRVYVYHL